MRRRTTLRGLLAAATVGLAGCSDDGGPYGDGGEGDDGDGGEGVDGDATDGTDDGTAESDLSITSAAFDDGEEIPRRYTADGEDASPPLAFEEVPEEAAALALVVEDPDAPSGVFTHWLLWNVPADTTEIPEGQPTGTETLPDLGGAEQGTNDFGTIGYSGPAPPEDDDPHRYRFRLSALGAELDLPSGAGRGDVVSAVEDERIAEAELAGTYGR